MKKIKTFKKFESHHYQYLMGNDNDDSNKKDFTNLYYNIVDDEFNEEDYKILKSFYKKYPLFFDKFFDTFKDCNMFHDKVTDNIEDEIDDDYYEIQYDYVLQLLNMKKDNDGVPSLIKFVKFIIFLSDTRMWGGRLSKRRY